MPLFSAISAEVMDDSELLVMIEVCTGILPKLEAIQENHPHRGDYLELRGRLEAEQRKRALQLAERTRAATAIQAATRGMLQRKALAKRTNAALTIQAAVRQHQAQKKVEELRAIQAEAFRQEQERLVQEQLAREAQELADAENAAKAKLVAKKADDLERGGKKLTENKVDLARVKEAQLEKIGELVALYEEALAGKKKGAGQSSPTVRKINTAKKTMDAEVAKIVDTVKAALAEEAAVVKLARTVTLPADFRQSGASVEYGTFYYPGAGYIKIGDKTYNFHPNRTFVHVRQEVADNASLADAQRYLNSSLAACREVIATGRFEEHRRNFADGKRWNIIYQAAAKGSGYAGELIHIDSGYEKSYWLPEAKQGKCKTCNQPKNYHTDEHKIT